MLNYLKSNKLLWFFVLMSILLFSCNEIEENTKNNDISNEEYNNYDSKINFRTVAILNETNKKVIDIASIAFSNSNQLKESQIILKIKNDHKKIGDDLKKITDQNLIIIPEPFFDLNLNNNFIKGVNSSYYLISLLEKEINNQIKLLDSIEKNGVNEEFKSFADKSKLILMDNNELLEDLL